MAMELEGGVGEERQETRKLLASVLRSKECGLGRNSSPEICGGRSGELQIRAEERRLGAANGGKRERRSRGNDRIINTSVTVAGTSARRRQWPAELRGCGSSSTDDEKVSKWWEWTEGSVGKPLSQKWSAKMRRGRQERRRAAEHCSATKQREVRGDWVGWTRGGSWIFQNGKSS